LSGRKLFLILVIADALCFGVALLGHIIWNPVPGGPQMMQIWQLLAWIFFFSLLLLIILAAGSWWLATRRRQPMTQHESEETS